MKSMTAGMEAVRVLRKVQNRIRMIIKGGNGGPTKETMLIIFLSGILIFVILLPTENNNGSYEIKRSQKKTETANALGTTQTDENKENDVVMDEYRKGLERELEEFLSSVAGVGEVKVLIYMKNSQEYVVEKDTPISNSVNGENSELRKDESTVYTVNESGDEVPFVVQTKRPAIDGVVISAQGAYDEGIKLQIVRLVMALYGVEANKVEVLMMR